MQSYEAPGRAGSSTSHSSSEFSATSWTLVGLAGAEDTDARQAAITRLLLRYLPPLRSHLMHRKRMDPHLADDLLQDFVTDKVLSLGIMQKAAREKGKFRTFLLVALDRFVSNRLRDQRAAKRRPADGFSGLAVEDTADECAYDADANRSFEVHWARNILEQAISRMRETCLAAGRERLWELFDDRVVGPCLRGTEPTPYAQLAARFSFQSPTEAGNVVLTGKRMFVRLLHDVIAEYARDEDEIQEEIADLRNILAMK